MTSSTFRLVRMRVLSGSKAVYDQSFHNGVNIIRGENGSGKSTIADFIFYVLGGEFENWKSAASTCDEVQAEVVTLHGTLTLRREVGKAQSPIYVFFGSMKDAELHGLDGWERYPIRRSDNHRSFSQVFFKASGIPEAQSQGASNITMHQIMRLLYSDQRTPSALLFRYEPFDTREIREAVGDLLCGLSVYELYETELALRDLGKQFDEKSRRFSVLLAALPREESLARPATIDTRVSALKEEYERLLAEIDQAEVYVDQGEVDTFSRARIKAGEAVRKSQRQLGSSEERAHVIELEVADLQKFLEYLSELYDKVGRAEGSSDIVGSIDFTHCPACLRALTDDHGDHHCVLCGAPTDPEQERSRYLQIKTDLEIQLRESRQLLEEKTSDLNHLGKNIRAFKRAYQELLSDYAVRFQYSTSPRESFVAQRFQRLGQIDRERSELDRLRERATEIELLSAEKAELQSRVERLSDRLKSLEAASQLRRSQALTRVSEQAKNLLRRDLDRQVEFRNPQTVDVNFGDNSVLVDGELNFAESSNVIVKNSAISSLLFAACADGAFFHPRFLLLDNIEDKGMEQDRSHNFQRLITTGSITASLPHQIIFTTSMISPDLNIDEYVVGPYYTHATRSLDLGTAKPVRPTLE